jgi:hypothetical protein
MRGEYWWKVRRVLDEIELGNKHASSSYGSLKIVYYSFRVDELIGDVVVAQHRADWRSFTVKELGDIRCGMEKSI